MLKLSEQSPSGFAVALHARFTAADYVHQTYSKAWSAIYSQKGYVMQDPTVSFGFQKLGCVRWSALAAEDTMKIYEQARAFGLGVVLATQNPMDVDYRALSNAGLWFVVTAMRRFSTSSLSSPRSSAASPAFMSEVWTPTRKAR